MPDQPALNAARLDAYLHRIGLPQRPTPTREALDAIVAAHLQRIPFENIDVLLGRPIDIALDAVFDKLVTRERGGYCFEHNTLLAAALTALDFDVVPLAARVRFGIEEGVPTPQSHLLLRVRVAHRDYIADAGFGGPNPPCSLPLSEPAPEGLPYRLVGAPLSATSSGAFHLLDLELKSGDEWIKLYRFDLSPQAWIDYAARNWYVCTHPDSIFLHRLMAARTDGEVRLTMTNGELTERDADGGSRQVALETPAQIVATLRERIGVRLDDETAAGLTAWLARRAA
ncbi:arylamine N-acetyltransferase [Cupriavidus gilardii]|uniref:arylamine N-acetyltransferase family protein n=1 Tax=Cupriavidus gilardii TaxID=82541 RepID=UPI001EE5160D|nr:arylamine N-acetyltransferase [Cupriavidus gilardii]MCG5260604.1 arylamine N-acetyltransferase [Cupriavidus gilardii]MDF9431881.1 arylamine N-acetyltransferase [Cupriavidus gilardii]